MAARDPKPQLGLFDRISRPTTRAHATPASRQAAEAAEKHASQIARLVLQAHAPAGVDYTSYEVAHVLGEDPDRVKPRVSNLVITGLLECTGAQRPSDLGRPADVHRITGKGLKALTSDAPLPRPPRSAKGSAA